MMLQKQTVMVKAYIAEYTVLILTHMNLMQMEKELTVKMGSVIIK
jgi:hypothetical protein